MAEILRSKISRANIDYKNDSASLRSVCFAKLPQTWPLLASPKVQVFFNATEYGKIEDKEEKAFFKFLLGNSADDDLTRTIAEKVNRAKKSAAFRRQYMTWEQEMKHLSRVAFDEGKAEGLSMGLERGARQKAIENAKNALSMGLSVEQVSKITGLSVDEIVSELNVQKVQDGFMQSR